ncbi:MAG: IclR family transcriptional regulator C-terminal domain-containing protein, partial [Microbacterium sp.]
QYSPGGKYFVGPLLDSAAAISAIDHCVEVALPHMEKLRDLSGETIHLARLQQSKLRFLAAMESLQPMRVTNRAGRVLPAHATAAGKLLLSSRSDEEAVAVLDGAVALTHRTIIDVDAFRAELAATRKAGYGRAISEAEIGVAAFAVPVFSPSGDVMCALTLTGPLPRFIQEGERETRQLSREPAFIAALRATSAAITADLRF